MISNYKQHYLRFSLFGLLLLLFPFQVLVAQDGFRFSHFMQNRLYYNPAYAGSTPYMETTMLYRNQWQGVEGAPETSLFTLQAPVSFTNVGLGLLIFNDRIGHQTDNAFFLNYAYHMETGDKSKLSFGLQAGMTNKVMRWSKEIKIDPNDPAIPDNDITAWVPNFGVGMYYYSPTFYMSLSAPRLLWNPQPTSDSFSDNFTFDAKNVLVYLNSGVVIPIEENIDLLPAILIQSSWNSSLQAAIHLNFRLENGLSLGAGYHSEDAWVLMMGYQFSQKLRFSYSFDKTISTLRTEGKTNHEIILKYYLSLRKNKITSPRYF